MGSGLFADVEKITQTTTVSSESGKKPIEIRSKNDLSTWCQHFYVSNLILVRKATSAVKATAKIFSRGHRRIRVLCFFFLLWWRKESDKVGCLLWK